MLTNHTVSLIVALNFNNVIGSNNDLPWHMKADLKRFKDVTKNKPVIMGRKTFESLGKKPLPHRQNVVLTRDRAYEADCDVAHSLNEAFLLAQNADEIVVIGGEKVYKQLIPFYNKMYVTIVENDLEGDAHFPWDSFDWNYWHISQFESHNTDAENPYDYSFYTFEKMSAF